MNNLQTTQEMKTEDNEGNVWAIKLHKYPETTNRWQLSFFFNEKEFSLMKPQNNQAAQSIWELLQKIRMTPKAIMEIEETEKKSSKSPFKERPTKRTLKIKGN